MVQLKNYLSKIDQSSLRRVVIVDGADEFEELINYLLKTVRPQKIYHVCGKNVCISCDKNNDIIQKCTITEVNCINDPIDAVIFAKESKAALQNISKLNPKYLIGKMSESEDYFSIWEKYHNTAAHIYIEKSMNIAENGYEILEWDQCDTNIELSVIIPVYNVAAYLPKCIESLIQWKADYVEFLFVNDGATDNSAQLIETYAKQDGRIRLICKENGGCASARNMGIERAKGRYIGFVDADDYVDETMFRKLLKRAMMGNYELTYCGYNEYYEDTKEMQEAKNDFLGEPYLTGTYRTDKIQLLAVNTRVAIWRCLYKKKVLDENNIRFHEDLKRFDDLPFRIEYIFSAKSAVCIPEHLYYYRLGRKGQDVSCMDERLFVHFDIFRHLDSYAAKHKEQRMWDLLQIVKLYTHRYALDRIQEKYKDEYRTKAKAQLKEHAGYFRNACLILMYAGKSNLGWFTRLWLR